MEELKKSNTYMTEEEIWGITLKLITALFVLHNMKIVHRDIKCANVFLCKDG
jgi:NIMA (never in mitosis gene a)-related kinase